MALHLVISGPVAGERGLTERRGIESGARISRGFLGVSNGTRTRDHLAHNQCARRRLDTARNGARTVLDARQLVRNWIPIGPRLGRALVTSIHRTAAKPAVPLTRGDWI